MLGFYWTFIIFGLMWIGIVFSYRGVLRILREREQAVSKGESTWTIGL